MSEKLLPSNRTSKFEKNAILKGTNFLEGATMRERNQQIGGHKAGEAHQAGDPNNS